MNFHAHALWSQEVTVLTAQAENPGKAQSVPTAIQTHCMLSQKTYSSWPDMCMSLRMCVATYVHADPGTQLLEAVLRGVARRLHALQGGPQANCLA